MQVGYAVVAAAGIEYSKQYDIHNRAGKHGLNGSRAATRTPSSLTPGLASAAAGPAQPGHCQPPTPVAAAVSCCLIRLPS